MMQQNYINHVVLVLDHSASMRSHANNLIKVADSQIAYLAQRSTDLDQETRVSIYSFGNTVECLVYDKDVLRLPSIRTLYSVGGMTALIDATLKSLDDLAQTATLYGDHAFLAFVLTDGQENRSRNKPHTLHQRLVTLPENWTVGVLVPNQMGVFEAKKFGFAPDNIAIWDTTSAQGVSEVGATIRRATDSFMENRAKGVRGTRSLFSTGADAVNAATVATLIPLDLSRYHLVPVPAVAEIRPFVESCGLKYVVGRAFYQLSKTETIQAQKQIAIREKGTNKVFTGANARHILGLPNEAIRVRPDYNPQYDVFVQSTSVNRKLMPGTELLLLQ